ncbi:MAG: hypothetical protein WKF96_02930 [Solirubrobacteraceae bacterium]
MPVDCDHDRLWLTAPDALARVTEMLARLDVLSDGERVDLLARITSLGARIGLLVPWHVVVQDGQLQVACLTGDGQGSSQKWWLLGDSYRGATNEGVPAPRYLARQLTQIADHAA